MLRSDFPRAAPDTACFVQVDDGAAEVNEAIIERLLDLDDVDSVYSNMGL